MIRARYRRVLMSTAAVMLGASIVGTLVVEIPAQAATPAKTKFVGIKCTSLTGNAAGTATFNGCSGNTGGASKPIAGSSFASGGTVTWDNSDTTTLGTPSLGAGTFTCPAGATAYKVSGSVTADTTGSAPVPGTYKFNLCYNGSTGALSTVGKVKIG